MTQYEHAHVSMGQTHIFDVAQVRARCSFQPANTLHLTVYESHKTESGMVAHQHHLHASFSPASLDKQVLYLDKPRPHAKNTCYGFPRSALVAMHYPNPRKEGKKERKSSCTHASPANLTVLPNASQDPCRQRPQVIESLTCHSSPSPSGSQTCWQSCPARWPSRP